MKNVLDTVLKFLPFVAVGAIGYFVYKKFFKKTQTLSDISTATTKEQSVELLSNGLTYLQAANNLVDSMFSRGFAGSLFFNVDEKALGEFMLTICKDEYRKLEQVYNQLKDEIWGFSLDLKKAAFCLSKGGTLSDDLNRCMNKKEKEQYLSHLFVL